MYHFLPSATVKYSTVALEYLLYIATTVIFHEVFCTPKEWSEISVHVGPHDDEDVIFPLRKRFVASAYVGFKVNYFSHETYGHGTY